MVTVLATHEPAAARLAEAAGRSTPWLRPIQRACLRTIEGLATELAAGHGAISRRFPEVAGARLCDVFETSEPAAGLRRSIARRPRHQRPSSTVVLGATVHDEHGTRIAIWRPDAAGFDLPPGVALDLRRRRGVLGPAGLAAAGIVASPWLEDDDTSPRELSALDVLDAGETACDLTSCLDGLGSSLGCAPDCGDLAGMLDCGAVACVPLDCTC